MKTYPKSELTLNAKNQVYHLGLSPEQISEKIILVGDQDRVNLVSSLFDSIEHQSQHREFVCHTGMYNGKKITALSTGIGTDNIDITINELDALVNIDLINRTDLPKNYLNDRYLWNFTYLFMLMCLVKQLLVDNVAYL